MPRQSEEGRIGVEHVSPLIRPLTRDDADQIRTLADASAREGFRFVGRFLEEMAADFMFDGRRQYFLGVFADRLVAIGGVTPDPYIDDPSVGRIRHVYVTADARRSGVGRALMTALEARAMDSYAALRLRTDTAAAAAFYESIGYLRIDDATATHRRDLAARR